MTSIPLKKLNNALYEEPSSPSSLLMLTSNNDAQRIRSCYETSETSPQRERSSAFLKADTSSSGEPLPVESLTIGFNVDSSEHDSSNAPGNDDKLCQNCILAQNTLQMSCDRNEDLMKGLSRTITRIKDAMEAVSKVDGLVAKQRERSRTPDTVFERDEDKISASSSPVPPTKHGSATDCFNLAAEMFPEYGAEMDDLLVQLHESLKEAKETCLSSVDSCFEDSTLLRSANTSKSALTRMQTISGGSSDLRGGEPASVYPHYPRHPFPHHHSETAPDDITSSLRRTHSETELTSSDMTSKVLTMETLVAPPIPAKTSEFKT